MSLFLHQIWRNVAFHPFLTNESSAVNGCRQNVMFLSAVLTLILTAPIHCKGSVAEQVMECYISPNLMKKLTHLHLGWPEGEKIEQMLIFGWTTPLKRNCSLTEGCTLSSAFCPPTAKWKPLYRHSEEQNPASLLVSGIWKIYYS